MVLLLSDEHTGPGRLYQGYLGDKVTREGPVTLKHVARAVCYTRTGRSDQADRYLLLVEYANSSLGGEIEADTEENPVSQEELMETAV